MLLALLIDYLYFVGTVTFIPGMSTCVNRHNDWPSKVSISKQVCIFINQSQSIEQSSESSYGTVIQIKSIYKQGKLSMLNIHNTNVPRIHCLLLYTSRTSPNAWLYFSTYCQESHTQYTVGYLAVWRIAKRLYLIVNIPGSQYTWPCLRWRWRKRRTENCWRRFHED